ncbi:MAG: TlpA disulfide reductase family protein [Bacteroidota bacterium]
MTRFVFPAALLLALAGCATEEASTPEAEVATDALTSGAPLVQIDGASELVDHLIEEDNEITVLNFWATWCAPCRVEFPDLIAYDDAMEDENVEVRFVSVDDAEMMPLVYEFLNEQELDERSYVAPNRMMLAEEFGPNYGVSLPTTLVLDREGIVRAAWTNGIIEPHVLDSLVTGVRSGAIDITTQL